MPKFKQPKIPRCPDMRAARGTFDEIRVEIQTARLKWLQRLWQAAEHVRGKALARFIEKAAKAATGAGLYAASYQSSLPWAIVRRFHDFDGGGGFKTWHAWLVFRGVYPPDFVRYKSARGVAFWDDIFSGKKKRRA